MVVLDMNFENYKFHVELERRINFIICNNDACEDAFYSIVRCKDLFDGDYEGISDVCCLTDVEGINKTFDTVIVCENMHPSTMSDVVAEAREYMLSNNLYFIFLTRCSSFLSDDSDVLTFEFDGDLWRTARKE